MSDLYATFATDAAKEREGKWFEFTGVKNKNGTIPGFLMARMAATNPAYQAAIEKHATGLRQAVELDTLTEDVAGPVMKAVFVDTVLLGWRNVFDRKGETEIQYSKENAAQLIADVPNLYFHLVEQAGKLANFRVVEVEQAAGEFSKPLGMPSDTENT